MGEQDKVCKQASPTMVTITVDISAGWYDEIQYTAYAMVGDLRAKGEGHTSQRAVRRALRNINRKLAHNREMH